MQNCDNATADLMPTCGYSYSYTFATAEPNFVEAKTTFESNPINPINPMGILIL